MYVELNCQYKKFRASGFAFCVLGFAFRTLCSNPSN